MAKLGGKARWEKKTAQQKSDHGKVMAEAKKRKKLSTAPSVQKRKQR